MIDFSISTQMTIHLAHTRIVKLITVIHRIKFVSGAYPDTQILNSYLVRSCLLTANEIQIDQFQLMGTMHYQEFV
jgi:hypothetical protein